MQHSSRARTAEGCEPGSRYTSSSFLSLLLLLVLLPSALVSLSRGNANNKDGDVGTTTAMWNGDQAQCIRVMCCDSSVKDRLSSDAGEWAAASQEELCNGGHETFCSNIRGFFFFVLFLLLLCMCWPDGSGRWEQLICELESPHSRKLVNTEEKMTKREMKTNNLFGSKQFKAQNILGVCCSRLLFACLSSFLLQVVFLSAPP